MDSKQAHAVADAILAPGRQRQQDRVDRQRQATLFWQASRRKRALGSVLVVLGIAISQGSGNALLLWVSTGALTAVLCSLFWDAYRGGRQG